MRKIEAWSKQCDMSGPTDWWLQNYNLSSDLPTSQCYPLSHSKCLAVKLITKKNINIRVSMLSYFSCILKKKKHMKTLSLLKVIVSPVTIFMDLITFLVLQYLYLESKYFNLNSSPTFTCCLIHMMYYWDSKRNSSL